MEDCIFIEGCDKELIREWIKDLRSGEFEQGRGYLCVNNRYCCLGVLGKNMETLIKVESLVDPDLWGDKSWGSSSPCQVSLLSSTTLSRIGLTIEGQDKLTELNDDGHSFSDIADFIEKELAKVA